MKVKLLKKIRKRFTVDCFPNKGVYRITDHYDEYISVLWHGHKFTHETLQGALDTILKVSRVLYYKHTRKYKLSQVKTRVWHKK